MIIPPDTICPFLTRSRQYYIMLSRFRRAMNYWMYGVSHPGYVLQFAQRDLHRVRISFYIILVFSFMMAFSSWVMWHSTRIPMFSQWVPLWQPAEHYFYQIFLSFPWFLVAYLSIAGVIYLFNCLAGKEAYYEDSLMISALSIAVPYLMFWWIPNTFLLPVMGAGDFLKWPGLFEYERAFFFPALWQLSIIGYGMRKVYNTNRVVCILAGLCSVLVFFSLYAPFMR